MFHANAVPAGGSVTVKAGARMRHGRDARVYIQRLLDFSLASATVNTAFTITGWIPDNMRLSMLWRVNRHRVKGNVVIEWTGNAGANSIAIFFVGSTNMYANDAALGRGLPAANVTSLGAGRYRADIPFYTFFTTLQGPAYNPVTIRGQFLTGGSTTITNVLVRKESWFEIIHTMVEAYLPTDTVVTVNQRIRGWKPTALSEWGFTDDTFITPPNYGPPAQDPYAIYSSVLLTFICSKSGNHTIQFRSTDRVKTAVGSITFSPTAVGDGTYSYTWSGSISYAGKIVAGEPLEFYFSTIPLSGTVIVKAGSKIN